MILFLRQVVLKEIMNVKPHQIFIDIGHGVANTCLQAAYTCGCEARGLEVDYFRNLLACQLNEEMQRWYDNLVETEEKVRYWLY